MARVRFKSVDENNSQDMFQDSPEDMGSKNEEVHDGSFKALQGRKTFKGTLQHNVFKGMNGFQIWKATYDEHLKGTRSFTLKMTSSIPFETGAHYEATGTITDWKGNLQFDCSHIHETLPTKNDDIVTWIFNNREQTFRRVTNISDLSPLEMYHGVLSECMENVDALTSMGFDESMAQHLVKGWQRRSQRPKIENYLRSIGVSHQQIEGLFVLHGDSVLPLMRKNPWTFIFSGWDRVKTAPISLEKCDIIARAYSLDFKNITRFRAVISLVMREAMGQGHTMLPLTVLHERARKTFGLSASDSEIGFEESLKHNDVILEERGRVPCCYLLSLYQQELAIVNYVQRAAEKPPVMTEQQAEDYIKRAERDIDKYFPRDDYQYQAAVMALCHPFSIITGGPGTGKSTVQKLIVTAYEFFMADNAMKNTSLDIEADEYSSDTDTVALMAPTGRAAKRLSQASARSATTVHRALGYDGSTYRGFIKAPFVAVDESSMTDLSLTYNLFEKSIDAQMLLIGDKQQLASVGPGVVFGDLIESGCVPTTTLKRIRRQAEDSGIPISAQRINQGEFPIKEGEVLDGFDFMNLQDSDDILEALIEMLTVTVPMMGYDPLEDVQVLVSIKGGLLGTVNLNQVIKRALNPERHDERTIFAANNEEKFFTVGDVIMQTRNTENAVNGDLDRIKSVFDYTEKVKNDKGVEKEVRKQGFIVDYDGVEKSYNIEDKDYAPAYARTIHKAQGGECPIVILIAPKEHRFMLSRNILYTGETRGKKYVTMMGDAATIRSAISNGNKGSRYSLLAERLKHPENYDNEAAYQRACALKNARDRRERDDRERVYAEERVMQADAAPQTTHYVTGDEQAPSYTM